MPVRIGQHWRLFGTSVVALVSAALMSLVLLVVHQRNVDHAAREAVRESCLLRLHMERVFSLMQDIEVGPRGFVITGRDTFLEPYERAQRQLPEELAKLRTSAGADHELDYADRLNGLVSHELKISDRIVASRRVGSSAEVEIQANVGQGKAVMDQTRTLLETWEAREREQLDQRLAAAAAADRHLTIAFAALAGGVFLILILMAWVAVALAQSREEANAANQAKSAFLAMMSHELRTPLNGVLGMAHALASSSLDERQGSYVQVIENSGNSLLLILNDILDLSKIEAGRLEIETISYCLTELLASIEALWSGPAAEKGLRLVLELDGEIPAWITGDPTRLRQVLTNLLSNAIKFTERGEVRLTVGFSDSRLRFAVADTGAGISPMAQARLFQDFSQAEVSTGRKFGGTGLGLSISRRLCRMMGGDLVVQSREGAGSTFRGTILVEVAESPNEVAQPQQDAGIAPMRILAVDDNASNRA